MDKERDQLAELWRDLVHKVYRTPDGFQGLSEAEKQYFAVCLFDGEVYQEGFESYLSSYPVVFVKYAILGLEAMGATQSLAVLREAIELVFGSAEWPETPQPAWGDQEHESLSGKLNELGRKLAKDVGELPLKSKEFAEIHGLV